MNSQTLRKTVYDNIIEDILNGTYRDKQILTESELTTKHGFSKSTVRAALIDLCNEGILRNVPRVGYFLIPYSNDYYRSIIQFRDLIEPHYLEMYWDNLTKDKIITLEAFNSDLLKNAPFDDPIAYWRMNVSFHLKLASLLSDKFYYEILERVLNRQTFVFAQNYWNQWNLQKLSVSSESHESFIENLKSGDKERTLKQFKEGIGSALKL